jgi:AraC family transcriptional regulator, melibiose operon regulatory protein
MTDYTEVGFRPWTRAPTAMAGPHCHPELEANYLPQGRAVYHLGGREVEVPAGRLLLFWGGIPHQLLQVDGVPRMHWLTVPLRDLLALRLPSGFLAALFSGEALVADDAEWAPIDTALITRWSADWDRGSAWRQQTQEEIGLRLRRAALAWQDADPPDAQHASLLERTVRVIAERFSDEELDVREIARLVAVHPKYLTTAFKRACGIGVQPYLSQLRLAHAQHLLRSTDHRVADIALASGFASQNAFYSAFAKHFGITPSACRDGFVGMHG